MKIDGQYDANYEKDITRTSFGNENHHTYTYPDSRKATGRNSLINTSVRTENIPRTPKANKYSIARIGPKGHLST